MSTETIAPIDYNRRYPAARNLTPTPTKPLSADHVRFLVLMAEHRQLMERSWEITAEIRTLLAQPLMTQRRVDGQARDVDTERRGEVERRRRTDRL